MKKKKTTEATDSQALPPGVATLVTTKAVAREVKQGSMLAHSVMGKSIREIAALFDMPTSTVGRWLKEAKQNEQLQLAKGIVGERLVPKAIAVYDRKLEEGDLEAARDILFGAGVLVKSANVAVTAQASPLEAFRKKYFGDGEVIEAEKAPDEQK